LRSPPLDAGNLWPVPPLHVVSDFMVFYLLRYMIIVRLLESSSFNLFLCYKKRVTHRFHAVNVRRHAAAAVCSIYVVAAAAADENCGR